MVKLYLATDTCKADLSLLQKRHENEVKASLPFSQHFHLDVVKCTKAGGSPEINQRCTEKILSLFLNSDNIQIRNIHL